MKLTMLMPSVTRNNFCNLQLSIAGFNNISMSTVGGTVDEQGRVGDTEGLG
jgi:hypothetical protein